MLAKMPYLKINSILFDNAQVVPRYRVSKVTSLIAGPELHHSRYDKLPPSSCGYYFRIRILLRLGRRQRCKRGIE
jgi:hypothetical protein